MNSMKRRIRPSARAQRASGRIDSSFRPRRMTVLILIGARPASRAAAIPSSTFATGKSTPFIRPKTSSSSESRLTVTRASPASRSGCASERSAEPFVVSVTSTCVPSDVRSGASNAIRCGRSRRTRGSPPVMRSLWTPRPTNTRATRSSSSNESTSLRGRNAKSRPNTSAGMQYGQRKLQRSVTEIRRSRRARPRASGRPGDPSNTTGSGSCAGSPAGEAADRGRRGVSWMGSTRLAMVRPRRCRCRARGGARCHRRASGRDLDDVAGTTGADPWYLQRTALDPTCSLSCRHAPELCPAHRGEDLVPIMATTDAKTGIRLPWGSNRSTSPERANEEPAESAEVDTPWPVTDTAQGESAAETAAEPAGHSDTPSEEQVSAVTSAPTPARKPAAKPTKFLADLTKAMQAAAEAAREQSLTQFQADAKTFVELIHERSATENTAIRATADEDVAGIRDWSKAEIARIREETERKISARK